MPYKNPEDRLAQSRRWKSANRSKVKEYYQKAMREHGDRERANRKAWRDANPKKAKSSASKWRKKNLKKLAKVAKIWRDKNPEKQEEIRRRFFERNAERVKKQAKERFQKNKSKIYRKTKQRKKSDPACRLSANQRTRIGNALKDQKARKSNRSLLLVGCTPRELAIWIETKFKPGMSWENRREWHVDHIRPCVSFDLTDPEQQAACFHFTNLQPLWAAENLRKHGKWEKMAA